MSTWSAICRSRSVSRSPEKNSMASRMGRRVASAMDRPPTSTFRTVGLRRAPWHAGHGISRMNDS